MRIVIRGPETVAVYPDRGELDDVETEVLEEALERYIKCGGGDGCGSAPALVDRLLRAADVIKGADQFKASVEERRRVRSIA